VTGRWPAVTLSSRQNKL